MERVLKRENPELEAEWSTDSDCEVLLHLFKKHGPSFLERNEVNGMYAFIAFDRETDQYVVARDPVGIIPLYQVSSAPPNPKKDRLCTRFCGHEKSSDNQSVIRNFLYTSGLGERRHRLVRL